MTLLTGLFQDFTLITYIDLAISIVLLVLASLFLHKFVKNHVITLVVIVMFVLKLVNILTVSRLMMVFWNADFWSISANTRVMQELVSNAEDVGWHSTFMTFRSE
jgi:hypothetical protein